MQYTDDKKQEAINLYFTSYESILAIAQKTGVPRTTLYGWISKATERDTIGTETAI